MSLMTLHCPECREDRLFERPHPTAERRDSAAERRDSAAERRDSAAERRDRAQCHDLVEPLAERPDGAGGSGECAEFACVECGTALFAGFALPIMVGAPEHTRARRQPPGRAA